MFLRLTGILRQGLVAVLVVAMLSANLQTSLGAERVGGTAPPPALAAALLESARTERDPETRAQLAATARRLPSPQALPIVAALLSHDEDVRDAYVPLLCWWVIEHHAATHRDEVLALFKDAAFWDRPLVFEHILPRLMRRFAAAGRRQDLIVCAELLRHAPSPRHASQLMKGFEEAFRGRALTGLPDELVAALASLRGTSLLVRLRQGEAAALDEALNIARDPQAKPEDRQLYLRTFGELKMASTVPDLLALATSDPSIPLRKAALSALGAFEEQSIGARIAQALPGLPVEVRLAALNLLTTRPKWSLLLLQTLESGQASQSAVPAEISDRLRAHADPAVRQAAARLFPKAGAAPPGEFQKRLAEVETALRGGPGNPYAGEKTFLERCGACHKLFHKGGSAGPDLTHYQRDNLGTLLVSILNPNAEIREGFAASEVETKDGRSLSGFVVDRDASVLVLRTLDGESTILRQDEIESTRLAGRSLMPEGLLDDLNAPQLRDFFAYLRSSQPITR